MRPVDAHLADVLDLVAPLPPLPLELIEAVGGVLAEDVTAERALPPFDNSAMDGYAVCAVDVAQAGEADPVSLPVVADIAAGDPGIQAIRPGMCARITTGAPLPAGADAVVPVEWTDGGLAKVWIRRAVSAGHAIRRAGDDVEAGQTVLRAGTRIGPREVALLAAIGRERVSARPRPRVAVISTGSELVPPGAPVGPGQIHDSNSFMLAAAALEAGCVAHRHGAVPDDPREVTAALEDALVRADVVLTSGGVSMGGERDVVKEVLSRLGTVRFVKVAMQPGMPQGLGVVGAHRTPIFTLPGNPVSAYVCFQLFVRPALRKMQGLPADSPPTVSARLTAAVTSPAGRRSYIRGRLEPRAHGTAMVTPLRGQSSHQLATLARADALIVVPEQTTDLPPGAEVDVVRLPEPS